MISKILKYNEIPASLTDFLAQTDASYIANLTSISLFHKEKSSKWTSDQKKLFAAIFYHIRGHFINFMWYMANFTSEASVKKIIMDNMNEELGNNNKFSHEFLYQRFAFECGVDIHEEIIHEKHNLDFAKEFNKGHMKWLVEHDAEEQLAAFAAYERLDNIDYPFLADLAKSLNISSFGMTFFRVHIQVEHFSAVLKNLIPIWERTPEKVERAFQFINSHQHRMWQQLSQTLEL